MVRECQVFIQATWCLSHPLLLNFILVLMNMGWTMWSISMTNLMSLLPGKLSERLLYSRDMGTWKIHVQTWHVRASVNMDLRIILCCEKEVALFELLGSMKYLYLSFLIALECHIPKFRGHLVKLETIIDSWYQRTSEKNPRFIFENCISVWTLGNHFSCPHNSIMTDRSLVSHKGKLL